MLIAGVGASAAFLAGILLAAKTPTPASIASENAPSSFTLTAQSISDPRDVTLELQLLEDYELRVARTGIVTAFTCSPGSTLTSWESSASIDGQPLLNFYADSPFWRDLAAGDHGPDATAIQAELNRIGLSVQVDGKLGEKSIRAVNARLSELGATVLEPSVISKSSLLWLPAQTVTAGSCLLSLGATVDAGTSIVSVRPTLAGAAVKILPENLVPGERAIRIHDALVAVDEKGQVPNDGLSALATAPAVAAALSETPEAESSSSTTASVSLDAVLQLTAPVAAWAVPPGSITAVEGTTGCVHTGGTSYVVSIVASELGKSFVTFREATSPPRVIDAFPDKSRQCD